MVEILQLVGLTILLFLSFLVPVRAAALAVRAERCTFGQVAVAVAVMMLAVLLTGIVLQPYLALWWLIPVSLVLSVGVFSSILGSPPVRAIAIAVAFHIVAALMLLLLLWLLSTFNIAGLRPPASLDLFRDNDVHQETIEEAATLVCDCRSDQACLRGRFAQLSILVAQQGETDPANSAEQHVERARRCVNRFRKRPEGDSAGPDETLDQSDREQLDGDAVDSDPAAAAQTATEAGDDGQPARRDGDPPVYTITPLHQRRWSYREVSAEQAGSLLDQVVRVTRRSDGNEILGRLDRVGRNGTLSIVQRRFGGTFTIRIPRSQIEKLELRSASNR